MYLEVSSVKRSRSDATNRTYSNIGFSRSAMHLIPESFDVIQAIADDDSLWTELSRHL